VKVAFNNNSNHHYQELWRNRSSGSKVDGCGVITKLIAPALKHIAVHSAHHIPGDS
jgi:hypothetical protein